MGSISSRLCPDDSAGSNSDADPCSPSHGKHHQGHSNSTKSASGHEADAAQVPLLQDVQESPHKKTPPLSEHNRSVTSDATPQRQTSHMGSAAKSLEEYELLAFLGQGSFAEVTLARHKPTRELFAVKKISKRRIRDAGSVEQAFTERLILASLRHPFLVKLHQAFQSPSHLYFVLQFAHGGDLRTFLQQKGAPVKNTSMDPHNINNTIAAAPAPCGLSLDRICFFAAEVTLALVYLHHKGFVYRDLKPENILMQRDGHLMLTDFGVAKQYQLPPPAPNAASEHLDPTSDEADGKRKRRQRRTSFVGTRQYMSPEILQGHPHDSRTDWWSFGALLFEMFAGHGPFDAANNEYQLFQEIVERPELEERIRQGLMSCSQQAMVSSDPPGDQDNHCVREAEVEVAAVALVDLIVSLLQRDPTVRLSGVRVLEHKFFHLPLWTQMFGEVSNVTSLVSRLASEPDQIACAKYFIKSVKPPYIPHLRGNEDLRCFPAAMSCSTTCLAKRAVHPTTANIIDNGSMVQPSAELFAYMLQIDDTEVATTYYDAGAEPNNSAPQMTPMGVTPHQGEEHALVGVAYTVDTDDNPYSPRSAASSGQLQSQQGDNSERFDGFTVAYFNHNASAPGSQRPLESPDSGQVTGGGGPLAPPFFGFSYVEPSALS